MNQEYLKSILSYDPCSGLFTWIISKNNRAPKGSVAGSIRDGYRIIGIDGRQYKAHKLAVLYMTGHYPVHPQEVVDHKDTIRDNNSWSNLWVTDATGNANNSITKQKMRESKLNQSENTRKKISESMKGKILSVDHRLKISDSVKQSWKGRKISNYSV